MAEGVANTTRVTMGYPDGFHILAELISTEGLTAPIKASGRIKYTCIAVSKHYIGLGASSGSLYIFHRNTFRYLQVFSNSEGALTKVSFAPNDNLVGIATSRGAVIAWELNIEKRERSEQLAVSSAHRNGHVTAMIWDSASERLFTGDNHGRITLLNVYHRKMSGLFKLPTELVMDADSSIVQLDFCDDKLLASTLTKCFICDTKKKQVYAVGTRLRDGQFGACFLQKATKEFPLVYSARPGSRIWEVNIVGQVQATHQFKHLLAIPSLPIVGPGHNLVLPDAEHQQKPQSLNFAQLLNFGHGNNLLLTWTTQAIYVFDPARIKVLVWSQDLKDILWACVYKSRIYCLHPNSQVKCYTLLSAERCVSKLFALSLWEQCAQTAIYFSERIKQGSARRYVPRSLIQEVNYQLMDGSVGFRMIGQLEELLSNMEDDGLSTPGSSRRSSLDSFEGLRLDSGIYLVRNRAGSDDSVEDFPVQNVRPAVVNRESQVDDSIREMEARFDDSMLKEKLSEAAISRENVETESHQLQEVTDNVAVAASLGGNENIMKKTLTGFDIEDDEEIDGPSELQGPAGINWGFGHGRIPVRRESSLLAEIAEKSEDGQTNEHALVKDGELDTSIAESLSSTVEPTDNAHTDTQPNNQAESSLTELASANNYDNQQNRGSKDEATLQDTPLPILVKNQESRSSDPKEPIHPYPRTDNQHKSQLDQLRIAPNQESSTTSPDGTRQQYSQMGFIPNRATLTSSRAGVSSEEMSLNSHLTIPPQIDNFQESSTRNNDAADYKLRSFSVDPGDDDATLLVMRRTLSLPNADHVVLSSGAAKGKKQTHSSKEKKRSKKTRIIDFDNPEESKTNVVSKNTVKPVLSPPKDTTQLPSESPTTSTPTKRSQNVSTVHATPTSQMPLQPEPPPSTIMDAPRSNDATMGAGSLHYDDELIWGASPMMYGLSGPRMAAQFIAPSFSAMKETLSSKLVKTKEFLKQMNEPEVGSVPIEIPVTVVRETTAQLQTQQNPHQAPTKAPKEHVMPNASSANASSGIMEADIMRSASQKVHSGFEVEVRDKTTYCQDLDDVIWRVATATWEAKHKLQDPKLSLNTKDCRYILKTWLGKLQLALSPKNYTSETESGKESQTDRTEFQNTVLSESERLASDCAVPGDYSNSADNSFILGAKLGKFQHDVNPSTDANMSRNNSLKQTYNQSNCQLSDPFGLPEYIFRDLSRLAMLCFEMSVYESSCADRVNQSDHEEASPPESDQSNSLLHSDGNLQTTLTTRPLIGYAREQPIEGCVFVAMNVSFVELDRQAAAFVKSFFFLLDVDRMQEVLKWRQGWRDQTMAAILDCLEARAKNTATLSDDIDELVDAMKTRAQKGCTIDISNINRLLQHGKCELALDFMLDAFPVLAPWEVMHLTQAVTVPSGCFLDYAVGLLDSVEAMDRDAVLASICSDPEVKGHLLTSTLTQGSPSTAELFCSCGQMPRPGAHKRAWQNETLANQILSLPVASHNRLLDICRKHGYWHGVLQLCQDLQQRELALKVSLQLGDIRLLGKDGFNTTNMDEWVLLLNLMSKLHQDSNTVQCLSCQAIVLSKQDDDHWLIPVATTSKDTSDWSECEDRSSKPECDWLIDSGASQDTKKLPCDWSPTVTWENIGTLLVKSVGPVLAARMLTDIAIPSGLLRRDFFKNCILASMIEKQERNVCQNFLEGLDTYLWSQRNNTLTPLLYYSTQEESRLTINRGALDTEKPRMKVPGPGDISQNSLCFLEDHDCHWGTNVKLNSECVMCGLPLTASVSMESTGRLAFQCGHVFHSACVVEKACLVCYEQNYQPVYKI